MPKEHPEEIQILMMKAVDGLLDEAQEKALQTYLRKHPEAKEELDEMMAIKEGTDHLRQRIAAAFAAAPPREKGLLHLLIQSSFFLIFVGITWLAVAGAWLFFHDKDIPLAIKAGHGLLGGASLILFLYLVIQRLRHYKNDPYNEIDQ
jgi:hypothetical protein